MTTNESLISISKFIAGYSAHLMGAGVHTSRVIRNSKRIGEAYGVDVKLSVFHKNIILTIIDNETREACNEVIDIPPHPISFEHNSELSALSWEVYDKHLSLHELSDKFNKIISAPKNRSAICSFYWSDLPMLHSVSCLVAILFLWALSFRLPSPDFS